MMCMIIPTNHKIVEDTLFGLLLHANVSAKNSYEDQDRSNLNPF